MLWASQARTQTHKQKNRKIDTEESPETGLVLWNLVQKEPPHSICVGCKCLLKRDWQEENSKQLARASFPSIWYASIWPFNKGALFLVPFISSISFFLAQTVDSQNALRLKWIVRQVADKHYLRGKNFRVHIWISTLTLRIEIQSRKPD